MGTKSSNSLIDQVKKDSTKKRKSVSVQVMLICGMSVHSVSVVGQVQNEVDRKVDRDQALLSSKPRKRPEDNSSIRVVDSVADGGNGGHVPRWLTF